MGKLEQASGVIVGMGKAVRLPKFMAGRRRRWVLLIVAVLLITGVASFMLTRQDDHGSIMKYDAATMPTDYEQMTAEQVRAKLYADTKIDVKDLQSGHITSRTFKDFGQAYQAAQALAGLKDYARATAAYAVAEGKAPQGASADFYEKYSAAADLADGKELARALMKKAEQAIRNDRELSEVRKKELLEKLAMKQKLKELGY